MAFDTSELSPAERFVVERTAEGELAVLQAAPDSPKPSIRAEFLRRLLLQIEASWPVRLPGVRICGARIEGALDLQDCKGAGGAGLPTLELIRCELPAPMNFAYARLARLSLFDCAFAHLNATGISVDGLFEFMLVKPIESDGQCRIDAAGARIQGDVFAEGARLVGTETPEGDQSFALSLRGADVGGQLAMSNFSAEGGINLDEIRIAGGVYLQRAKLAAPKGRAIAAQSARFAGGVSFDDAEMMGCVFLMFARLGALQARGAVFNAADSGDVAFQGTGLVIDGNALLEGATTKGELDLFGAHIAGTLACDGAALINEGADAFGAGNAVVGGDVRLEKAAVTGKVYVLGAQIGQNFALRECEIANPRGRTETGAQRDFDCAIDATNVRVGGALLLNGAHVKGEILLADACIEGYLAFGGGRFTNIGDWAIRAPNARIGGNLSFKSGGGDGESGEDKTLIDGGVKFDRARIEGEVAWDGLELHGRSSDRRTGPIFSFANVQIGRRLAARALAAQDARINLAGASCAALEDDLRSGWGHASTRIDLEGFSYERLEGYGEQNRWRARCRWLEERSLEFSPQPYAALAQIYARAGRREDMRRVLLAERDARSRATPMGFTRIFSSLFGMIAGYGFAPARAARALVIFFALGIAGVIAMNDRGALVAADGTRCDGRIEPALYALDVALPVIDLGQERVCAPGRALDARLAPGREIQGARWRLFEEAALWRWAQGVYALLGALFTALAVITFSGVMKPKAND